MTENIRVNVHHVTRVEGHGNIVVDVRDGTLEQCELQIVETPRFFEAMLRGRPYAQASHITSRICGICAIGHATASLRATERALQVKITEQTELLRKLAFHGEMLDSHILHVYMLVAPDFLNVGSVIPLAASSPGRRQARAAHEEILRRPMQGHRRAAHAPDRHDGRRVDALPARLPPAAGRRRRPRSAVRPHRWRHVSWC